MIYATDNGYGVHYKTIGRQILFVKFYRTFYAYKTRNIVFKRQNNKGVNILPA